MLEERLRDEPASHRLTVKTKRGVQPVILLTTERIDRADCIPCLPSGSAARPTEPPPAGRG